jgi:hypothetical protein
LTDPVVDGSLLENLLIVVRSEAALKRQPA